MATTILYPERIYPDDAEERDVFGPDARIVMRDTTLLCELSPDDCAAADGLMIFRQWLRAEDIARFPNLRAIVRMGVGYDRIDRQAAAQRGIIVCNVPDYGTTEVADHAIALALALRRGLLMHHDAQRATPPASWIANPSPLLRRLSAQTFGIVGLGRIGTAVALRAKALGFRVMFFDPHRPNGAELAIGVGRARSLAELLEQADVLSLHTPHTPETQGMIGAAQLALLPSDAVLVSTARGSAIDIDALGGRAAERQTRRRRAGRAAGRTPDRTGPRPAARVPRPRALDHRPRDHHAAFGLLFARGASRHPHQVGRDDARRPVHRPAAERHPARELVNPVRHV